MIIGLAKSQTAILRLNDEKNEKQQHWCKLKADDKNGKVHSKD